MRIAMITPGAAGMLCGSCLHDNLLATSLLTLGEEVLLQPVYTPIRTDQKDMSAAQIFYGGINVYLQQKWQLFRHTPAWLDRRLDHPKLIRWLSKRSSLTDPAQLGELTVSMLQGETGHQHKELAKLCRFLKNDFRPHLIHLSNSLLLGMASQLKNACQTPLVCSLSGEDLFLEQLPEPYYTQARALLKKQAQKVDAFIAMNHYYANFMSDYLAVPKSKITVIQHTPYPAPLPNKTTAQVNSDPTEPSPIKPNLIKPCPIEPEQATKPARSKPLVIGYLARICPEKGVHLLLKAAEILAQEQEAPPFELQIAGYLGKGDQPYFEKQVSKAMAGPLAGKFKYLGELTWDEKQLFYQQLDLFCTPTLYAESKGLSALEAIANGLPVVLPAHGCYPELIQQTNGGVLHQVNNPQDLAKKMLELLKNKDQRDRLGQQGALAIKKNHTSQNMAQQTLQLYHSLSDISS